MRNKKTWFFTIGVDSLREMLEGVPFNVMRHCVLNWDRRSLRPCRFTTDEVKKIGIPEDIAKRDARAVQLHRFIFDVMFCVGKAILCFTNKEHMRCKLAVDTLGIISDMVKRYPNSWVDGVKTGGQMTWTAFVTCVQKHTYVLDGAFHIKTENKYGYPYLHEYDDEPESVFFLDFDGSLGIIAIDQHVGCNIAYDFRAFPKTADLDEIVTWFRRSYTPIQVRINGEMVELADVYKKISLSRSQDTTSGRDHGPSRQTVRRSAYRFISIEIGPWFKKYRRRFSPSEIRVIKDFYKDRPVDEKSISEITKSLGIVKDDYTICRQTILDILSGRSYKYFKISED